MVAMKKITSREPIVSPYRPPVSAERQAAIDRAVALMRKGLPWGKHRPPFTREEMHERMTIRSDRHVIY
jgi:hypothetical protein